MRASYPRRQQIRRLMRAGRCAVGAAIASAATLLASAPYPGLALALALVAVAMGC